MAGWRPLPPEAMVYGRVGGGTWGIERTMDCCDAHGVKATFFVTTLEALHYGEDHARGMCRTVLDRGHDAQLHVHPRWLGRDYATNDLTQYTFEQQRDMIAQSVDIYRAACGEEPVAYRSGGLFLNGDTLRALDSVGIGLDGSVAVGYRDYDLGEFGEAANVPRRLGPVAEVPVTTFAQLRLGGWAAARNFDINADSLAELEFVVDRAVAQGVTAVSLLMHSFSFVGRNRDSTEFWPAAGELARFERFLDCVAGRHDVEVVTFRELAARLDAQPELLDGPDFAPTTGLWRTYCRSWERFHTGWKNKTFALGLPVAAAGLAAFLMVALWWLAS